MEADAVQISMDGRGGVFDTIFIERFWQSVKDKHLYLHDYQMVPAVIAGVRDYMHFYNTKRLHQSLEYRTPAAV